MKNINNIKLKSLKQTKNFYIWELKRKESLTENERIKYIIALKSINKIIREKENPGEDKRISCRNRTKIILKERGCNIVSESNH
jgi:hypothetical protein